MCNFSLPGFRTVQKWIFSTAIVFCVIGHSMLNAEESSPLLLQKIQQNSFSIAPSVTISLNEALQLSDSRGAEIAKRLKNRIKKLGSSGN